MDLKDLVDKTLKQREQLDKKELFKHLQDISSGAWTDVLNLDQCGNYQFLSSLMLILKPRQVVELGGAMGVSALCMLATLEKSSQIYSITLEEHGLEFSFIKRDYPNLIKVIGDDLDMDVWPEDLSWGKTDFLYIDSLHTQEQLEKELDLYLPLLKEGTIVALDDIHINSGMSETWDNILFPKIDLTKENHYSGWGIFKYE